MAKVKLTISNTFIREDDAGLECDACKEMIWLNGVYRLYCRFNDAKKWEPLNVVVCPSCYEELSDILCDE